MSKDFSNFELGDNVYELAGGIIPDIADRLEVEVGDEPNSESLQQIMDQVGKNKVLRENEELAAFSQDEMADLVERSGVQKELRRSLWTPDVPITSDNVGGLVLTGGVANWQDRTAAIAEDLALDVEIYALGGSRVMDTDTEKANSNVVSYLERHGSYPNEADYISSVIIPRLVTSELVVLNWRFDTKDGDEMFNQFFEKRPDLLNSRLAMLRVANAGVIMALQLRDAARKHNPNFDSNPEDPQMFVATDSFPIAKTVEQNNDPAHFQKSATALRQVVLTAKKLSEVSL